MKETSISVLAGAGFITNTQLLAKVFLKLISIAVIVSFILSGWQIIKCCYLAASNDLTAKTKARENAKPLLEEAKVFDVPIRERTAQVTVALAERNSALESKQQQEDQWKVKQLEATQLLAGIDALKKWKEDNSARQPVAENQNLIVSKLGSIASIMSKNRLSQLNFFPDPFY